LLLFRDLRTKIYVTAASRSSATISPTPIPTPAPTPSVDGPGTPVVDGGVEAVEETFRELEAFDAVVAPAVMMEVWLPETLTVYVWSLRVMVVSPSPRAGSDATADGDGMYAGCDVKVLGCVVTTVVCKTVLAWPVTTPLLSVSVCNCAVVVDCARADHAARVRRKRKRVGNIAVWMDGV
jgi:hypothetical protein